jgi:hypothetical protein
MEKRAVIWIAVSSDKQAGGDKISLIEQERAAREWCDANGYVVVGILSVPGESRSESDVLTIFEEFAEKRIFAYHDLRKMWQAPRQFDVLVAYHDSRLGRSEALYTYVVSNVMRAGARIYCILGGWYEPKDYKLKMAIGMINVSSEMDRLVGLTLAKKLSRAEKGTLVHGVPCWAYRVERDERGQPLRKVPNEQHRIVIETAARLVAEGVPWNSLERRLFDDYGMGRGDIPFARSTFFSLFHHPNMWGNEVFSQAYVDGKRRTGQKRRGTGLWVFDASYPAPEGVRIFYGVLPPYFRMEPGELGDALQAELRRRGVLRGSARPHESHLFTGLLTCYYCGRIMAYHAALGGRYPYYICKSMYRSPDDNRCTTNRSVREEVVKEWFDENLRRVLDLQQPDFFMLRHDDESNRARLQELEARQAQLDKQYNRALDEQLESDDERHRARLRQRMQAMNSELVEIERQISTLKAQALHDTSAARLGYERLRQYPSLDEFWASSANNVNQILHGLLSDVTLVIRDGRVYGDATRS